MWAALNDISENVKHVGLLFIMICLDRGWKSHAWRVVKNTYCSSWLGRLGMQSTFIPYYIARGAAEDLNRLKNPFNRYREYKNNRGMSKYHDWIDRLGGYPYEVANADQLKSFYEERGFAPITEKSPEYVFQKRNAA